MAATMTGIMAADIATEGLAQVSPSLRRAMAASIMLTAKQHVRRVLHRSIAASRDTENI